MKWAYYYERFWDWSESTRIARISTLTDFDASGEVEEIAFSLHDEQAASRLVRRAIRMGVRFTPDEIIDLSYSVNQKTLVLAAENRSEAFTDETFDMFQDACEDRKAIKRIQREDCLRKKRKGLFEAQDDYASQEMSETGGFFQKLFGAGGRHAGLCDGDCENCPPHYGYRYGRWYYGHDHVHGCEFGGNRGGGGM